MKLVLAASLALAATAAIAQTAPTLDELKASDATCEANRTPSPGALHGPAFNDWLKNGYKPGFEKSCPAIHDAYVRALHDADAAYEAANPDLKAVNDFAKKLAAHTTQPVPTSPGP